MALSQIFNYAPFCNQDKGPGLVASGSGPEDISPGSLSLFPTPPMHSDLPRILHVPPSTHQDVFKMHLHLQRVSAPQSQAAPNATWYQYIPAFSPFTVQGPYWSELVPCGTSSRGYHPCYKLEVGDHESCQGKITHTPWSHRASRGTTHESPLSAISFDSQHQQDNSKAQ